MSSPHTAQLQPSLAPSSRDPAQDPWQAFSRLASLFSSPRLDGTTQSQIPLLSRVDTAPKPSPRRAPSALEKPVQHSESPASNLSLPLEKAIFPQNITAFREQRERGSGVNQPGAGPLCNNKGRNWDLGTEILRSTVPTRILRHQ